MWRTRSAESALSCQASSCCHLLLRSTAAVRLASCKSPPCSSLLGSSCFCTMPGAGARKPGLRKLWHSHTVLSSTDHMVSTSSVATASTQGSHLLLRADQNSRSVKGCSSLLGPLSRTCQAVKAAGSPSRKVPL